MSESEQPSFDPELINEEFNLERVRDEAIIQLKTVSGSTAADIGAGTGFMSEGLLDAELKVIAVESSPLLVEFMKEKFGDIKEFQAVLTEPSVIKLADESVDYVFANMYLHNAEDPQTSVKEINQVLKPGGKAAITDLILHDYKEITGKYNHRWPGFSFPDLYDWFINAGFRNISIEKLPLYCTVSDGSGEEFKIEIFIACGEK